MFKIFLSKNGSSLHSNFSYIVKRLNQSIYLSLKYFFNLLTLSSKFSKIFCSFLYSLLSSNNELILILYKSNFSCVKYFFRLLKFWTDSLFTLSLINKSISFSNSKIFSFMFLLISSILSVFQFDNFFILSVFSLTSFSKISKFIISILFTFLVQHKRQELSKFSTLLLF